MPEARAPSMVHAEADLSLRVIRDLLARNVDRVLVDSERQYRRILGWVRTTQPEFIDRIQLYNDPTPLFEAHGVDAAIRSTLNRRVDLPSGGYLLFDFAEAFSVIDVNTGRFVGGGGGRLEDTITRNNIEAAREVVRQLRLRDIGGIIVIDFIDMAAQKNRTEVLKVLQAELERDRTKTYVVEISPLGLVEMTRQNVTEGVREVLTRTCPTCGGEGVVLSEETMGVEAERRLRKLARASGSEAFLVRMNAKVASLLAGPGGAKLLELERDTGKFFSLESYERMPLEEVDVVVDGTREQVLDGKPTVLEGAEVKLRIDEPHMYNTTDGVGHVRGYPVVVGGAITYVGQEHKVRIDRITRATAFASLLDAQPRGIELPPEPGGMELPEFDREVGERLEIDQRSKPRTRRRTPAPKKTAAPATADAAENGAGAEAGDGAEAAEPAKPRRSRSRRKPAAAAEAAAATDGDGQAAELPAADAEGTPNADEGGSEAGSVDAAKRPRRRGRRGGRGRTAKAAGEAAADGGDEPVGQAGPEPTAEPQADAPAEKPKPKRAPRRRTPAKPAAADADAAPAAHAAPAVAEAPAQPAAPEVAAPEVVAAAPPPQPEPAAPQPATAEATDSGSDGDKRRPGLLGKLLGAP